MNDIDQLNADGTQGTSAPPDAIPTLTPEEAAAAVADLPAITEEA